MGQSTGEDFYLNPLPGSASDGSRFSDEEGVRYVPVRTRPPVTLLRHYRNPWKAAYHHFQRYSDIRVKGQLHARTSVLMLMRVYYFFLQIQFTNRLFVIWKLWHGGRQPLVLECPEMFLVFVPSKPLTAVSETLCSTGHVCQFK